MHPHRRLVGGELDLLARNVVLPGDYRLEWVGELGELNEALGRLELVVS